MKTCLWCANPCNEYFKVIAPTSFNLFGSEAEELRIRTANECNNYVEAI